MTTIKRYEYPFTDLEPGTYRYRAPNSDRAQTVTVELNQGMHVNARLVVRFTPGYYPSSLKDLPHGVYFEEIPADEKIVDFSQLWVGDRFQTLYDDGSPVEHMIWTKLDHNTARCHSREEIKLKENGFGYMGSASCCFEPEEKVKFIPVVLS